jgi:hypothetical protein
MSQAAQMAAQSADKAAGGADLAAGLRFAGAAFSLFPGK